MKRNSTFWIGAIGSAAAAFTLGCGVACADDSVVGQTFQEARAALGEQGLAAEVATTVGDREDWDSCIVTSANRASSVDGYGNGASAKMMVNLNCYANYGTAQRPGFSVQSPEGREMRDADVAAKQRSDAKQAAAEQQADDEQIAAAQSE